MFAQIRQFISFAGDYKDSNDSRRASLLNVVLLTLVVIGLFIVVIVTATQTQNKLETNLALGLFILVIIGLLALLRRGYLRLASLLCLIVLFVGGVWDAASFSGVRDPGMSFLIVVIALAALLLGGRVAIMFAVLSIGAGMFVHLAQSLNWLSFAFHIYTEPSLDAWIFLSIVFILAGLVMRSAVNNLHDALSRLADSNRELETTRASLEERVAARTRDLEQAGEIGRRLSQLRELTAVLNEAARLIQERFGLTSAQIFLVGPARRNLVLRARSGQEIRGTVQLGGRIPIAPGTTVGTAAVEGQAIVSAVVLPANDSLRRGLTAQATEIAIPLVSGEELAGVLQLYSNQADRLTRDTMPAFEALASELAIAIENAILFTEVTAARAEVELQARRLTRAGWEEFLNAIERSEEVGYSYDRGGLTPVSDLTAADNTKEVLSSVIQVTGVPIGAIQLVREPGQSWAAGEASLVESVAQRVAQQVENLRLLAEAERYRLGAEEASRRLTREGWAGYLEQTEVPAGYVYNQKEVLPLETAGNGHSDLPGLPHQHSLMVRGERIGSLELIHQAEVQPEANVLTAAVAERLSAHIENLRLADQREKALLDSEVRARYQANIAEAVAMLSGYGTQAIPDVLRLLGEAAQVSRVYYFESLVDEEGSYWRQVAEWCAPGVIPQINEPAYQRLPTNALSDWTEQLQKEGMIGGITRTLAQPLREILEAQEVLSLILLAVASPGRPIPGFIGFAETLYEREWSRDEIAALHTAASALSNTIIREDLFDQVQDSLEETESLYKASATLNTARSYNEVLGAMRDNTILGQDSQNVSINYFDRPWEEGKVPEWVDVLTRWTELPAEAVSQRYALAPFSSAARLLTPDTPAIIEDVANDTRLDANLRGLYSHRFGAVSTIFVPLAVGGQWFGYINAIYQQPTTFPAGEIRRLMALARQAAVAVQSIRLLEETNRLLSNETRQRKNADILVRASGRMSGVLNEDQIRQIVVDEIYNVLLPDQISLYQWDKATNAFRVDVRVLAAPGHDEDQYTVGRMVRPDERPDLWAVYSSNKPFLENQPQANQFLREHYCLPYMAGDEVDGVVELYHTARGATIRQEDQTICQSIVQQAALRLQNTRLFWQASERAEEMSAINEVARAVSRQIDQEQLIETIYEQVRRIMPADAFFIALYNTQTSLVSYPLIFDEGERFLDSVARPPRGKVGEVIASGEPILQNWTPEEWEQKNQSDQTLRLGHVNKVSASLIFIPLQIGRRIIGVMSAQSYRFNVYGARESALLTGIANHVAVAIENARLFEQAQARAEELAILNEMGQELTASLDLASINENVYRYTGRLMNAANFYIALYNSSTDEVSFPLAVEKGERVQWRQRRLGQGMTEYVVRNRESLFIRQNVDGWLAEHGVESIGAASVTWLGAPLAAGQQVTGVIAVQHETAGIYNEHHRELLNAVATQAAIAIENAHLFEQTQTRAEELVVLNEMSQALSATLNIDEVVDQIYQYTSRLMDTTNFYVALYDAELDEMEFTLDAKDGVVNRRVGRRRGGKGLTEYLIRHGQPLLFSENVQEHLDALGIQALGQQAFSWLGVPMGFGKQAVGVISVQSYTTPRLYNEHHRDLLSAIASQAAIALQNAHLFERATNARQEAEERLRETAALQQLGQSLAGTLQVNEILDIFFRSCLDVIGGFDYVMLSLVDKQQRRVRAVGGLGLSQNNIQQANQPLDSSDIMADIIRTGKTEIINGWDERFDKELFESEGHNDWVRVFTPISLRQENIGLVEAGSKKGARTALQESQVNLLKAFINQTALALDNAQRYEASQQTARREQILREVTARVRNAADVDTILRTAAQEVSRALGRKSFVVLGNGEAQPSVEKTEVVR